MLYAASGEELNPKLIKTAENHRTNLMRKLDLHNAVGLTRYAIDMGIVENSPFRLGFESQPGPFLEVRFVGNSCDLSSPEVQSVCLP